MEPLTLEGDMTWYDNGWGYANRLVELARNVALALPATADVR
jgi:glyceraldehyde-3-phosphate dehydrogenase/erythrose-4-phosphate dehydrogenase